MILDAIRRWFGGGETPDESDPCDGANPCEEALARLQELVDGELLDVDRSEIEAHFKACTACGSHLAMEEEFRKRVQAALQKPRCPDALRDRILTMIDAEDG